MPLVLLVPSSAWMKGEIEPRPDAVTDVRAIPFELMEIGDSVLVHLHVPQLDILSAIYSAQYQMPERRFRVLLHSECYEVGRIRPDRATPDELADYASWRKVNGVEPKEEPKPPKPFLH
jgi:hypothetical protein